jgi:hypothetical protein
MAAFAQADFVLAIGLFAAAALMSAQARRELTILAPIWWVLAVFAAMRPMYFPDALYSVHSKTLVPASGRLGRHRTLAPSRWPDWSGCFPIRRRSADFESELAALYQPHSE